MEQKILALDMGGTAIKAGLFDLNGNITDKYSWKHDYNSLAEKDAVEDLEKRVLEFTKNKEILVAGIGLAGLIATDNSVYRSTVLGSFIGKNIPEIFKGIGISNTSIDNDADCGGLGIFNYTKKPLLYLVLGSGLGSSVIDEEGTILNRIRFNKNHIFNSEDNPLLNDLGLNLSIPLDKIDSYIKKITIEKSIKKVLENGSKDYKIGSLVSARGVSNLYEMFTGEKKDAKEISSLARDKSSAKIAYHLMGNFLGYSIAKANEELKPYKKDFEIILSGEIMDSYKLFKNGISGGLSEEKTSINIKSSKEITQENPNLIGAYIQARRLLN
ncbi:MAG: ROK family transcriptional regulator [Candidatus Pacearchaeota archaeon]|jgi:hypothetical protein